MSAPVVKWICRRLTNLLGFEATEDVARYILAIEDKQDLEDYLLELLDGGVPENRTFVNQVLAKWTPSQRAVEVPLQAKVYRKKEAEDFIPAAKDKVSSAGGTARQKVKSSLTQDDVLPSSETGARKKSKYVALYSQEGVEKTTVMLKGRHVCECQCRKHKLISNCLKCGRVVCEQEGSGPCLFCGTLVCTRDEREVLSRGSKKSEKLYQLLTNSKPELDTAVNRKNRLLEYDRTSVRRTQVIDDEADYFTTDSNQWLSKDEKHALQKREQELREKRHASRLDRKVTLDFAGRRVLEDSETVNVYNPKDEVVLQVYNKMNPELSGDRLVNPSLSREGPVFVDATSKLKKKKKTNSVESSPEKRSHMRLQDADLHEMSDEGMCLSMHQPWASLLVRGIKLHEGRTWFTTHRGRLWIAATAKKPSPEEIVALERQYLLMYPDKELDFPTEYPIGCLLGCVDLKDCLPQEEYEKQYPRGESGSPYVFICENPLELVVKFPMKGKHKIYKLDSSMHQGAKKGLRFALKS